MANDHIYCQKRVLPLADLTRSFKIAASGGGRTDLVRFNPHLSDANKPEMVLFFKPECLEANTQYLIAQTLSRVKEAGYSLNSISALGYRYLERNRIMDRHYDAINLAARQGVKALDEKILEQLPVPAEDIYGAFEFMNKTGLSPAGLKDLWQLAEKVPRLSPGVYGRKISWRRHDYWLINGFHPFQLEYYYGRGRAILALVLEGRYPNTTRGQNGYLDWADMRLEFLGETDPAVAFRNHPRSLRGCFYGDPDRFGIREIDVSKNYLHLSAGPLEGMGEVLNLVLNSPKDINDICQTRLGFSLYRHGLPLDRIQALLANPVLALHDDDPSPIFDQTESLSPAETLKMIYQAYRRGLLD